MTDVAIRWDLLRRRVAAQAYPLVFATISGAHLYGFPSPDSDYDLRGTHVLPVPEVVGLDVARETIEASGIHEGVEVDLVTHDLRKFMGLMLRKNGYVLEQLYSPLVVPTSPAHEELKALGAKAGGGKDGLFKVRVVGEPHAGPPSLRRGLACQAGAWVSAASRPKSKRVSGLRVLRRVAKARGGRPSCCPTAPRIARTRGGSVGATASSRSKASPSASIASNFATVASGGSSLALPRSRRNSSNAASCSMSADHADGRRVWTTVSGPISLRGRLPDGVATAGRPAAWVVKPSRLAAATPDGNRLAWRRASCWMAAGLGWLWPNGVLRPR